VGRKRPCLETDLSCSVITIDHHGSPPRCRLGVKLVARERKNLASHATTAAAWPLAITVLAVISLLYVGLELHEWVHAVGLGLAFGLIFAFDEQQQQILERVKLGSINSFLAANHRKAEWLAAFCLVGMGAAAGIDFACIKLIDSVNYKFGAKMFWWAEAFSFGALVVMTVIVASVRVSLGQRQTSWMAWVGSASGFGGIVLLIVTWH
jgi:hypothetical protein